MASRGYEPLPDYDDYDYETPGPYVDGNANQTFSFGPPHSSTPMTYNQEMKMKTIQEEKRVFLKLLMPRLLLVEPQILKKVG